jgi:hypothetical protein
MHEVGLFILLKLRIYYLDIWHELDNGSSLVPAPPVLGTQVWEDEVFLRGVTD